MSGEPDNLKHPICLAAGASAFALACLSGCDMTLDEVQDGRLVESKVSPNDMVQAVVSAVNMPGPSYGATMTQPYQVYLRSRRGNNHAPRVILAAQRTQGMRVRWASSEMLFICYVDGHIFEFKNRFAVDRKNQPPLDPVEIVLRRVEKLDQC